MNLDNNKYYMVYRPIHKVQYKGGQLRPGVSWFQEQKVKTFGSLASFVNILFNKCLQNLSIYRL